MTKDMCIILADLSAKLEPKTLRLYRGYDL